MVKFAEIPIRQINSQSEKMPENAAFTINLKTIQKLLAESGLFDREYYQAAYPDVTGADIDPLSHYVAYGWRENRRPNLWFDSQFYLDDNPDISAGITNPLLHFLCAGFREGRRPNPQAVKRKKRLVAIVLGGKVPFSAAAEMVDLLASAKTRPDKIILELCQNDGQAFFVQRALDKLQGMSIQLSLHLPEERGKCLISLLDEYSGDAIALVEPNRAVSHDWLERLLASWRAEPASLHSLRCRWLGLHDGHAEIANQRPGTVDAIPLPDACAGVLIPPGLAAVIPDNAQYYLKYAPDFPGIWLGINCLLQGAKVTEAHAVAKYAKESGIECENACKRQLLDTLCCFRRELDEKLGIHTLERLFKRDLLAMWARRMGSDFNWNVPATYNQKIQWLKLRDDVPLKTICGDKYRARAYIREKVGDKYLVPLLGVWKSFDDIDFSKLPETFILKTTHGTVQNLVVKGKKSLDKKSAREKFNRWQAKCLAYDGFEFNYFDIEPLIVCEQYLGDNLIDYKVHCFNGEPKYIWVMPGRPLNTQLKYYSIDWQKIDVRHVYPLAEMDFPRPVNLELMLSLAAKLSAPFIHSRIDFYILRDNSIKVGELTFYPACGFSKYDPEKYDKIFGEMIQLPAILG